MFFSIFFEHMEHILIAILTFLSSNFIMSVITGSVSINDFLSGYGSYFPISSQACNFLKLL